MKRNLVGMLALLCLANWAASLTNAEVMAWVLPEGDRLKMRSIPESASVGHAPPWSDRTRETIFKADSKVVSRGYKLGGIELGDSRDTVEALAVPTQWEAAVFPNGLSGVFSDCPSRATRVAYNGDDKVVALRGLNLTLPNGTIIPRRVVPDQLDTLLASEAVEEPMGERLYPELGLKIVTMAHDGSSNPGLEVGVIDLVQPWTHNPTAP